MEKLKYYTDNFLFFIFEFVDVFQGYIHSIPVSYGTGIYICNVLMCISKYGACIYLYYGTATGVSQ